MPVRNDKRDTNAVDLATTQSDTVIPKLSLSKNNFRCQKITFVVVEDYKKYFATNIFDACSAYN